MLKLGSLICTVIGILSNPEFRKWEPDLSIKVQLMLAVQRTYHGPYV